MLSFFVSGFASFLPGLARIHVDSSPDARASVCRASTWTRGHSVCWSRGRGRSCWPSSSQASRPSIPPPRPCTPSPKSWCRGATSSISRRVANQPSAMIMYVCRRRSPTKGGPLHMTIFLLASLGRAQGGVLCAVAGKVRHGHLLEMRARAGRLHRVCSRSPSWCPIL